MDQLPLDKVVDESSFHIIMSEVINTRTPLEDGRSFSYKEVKHKYKDKTIYVMARHFPLDEVLKNGSGSCNICFGKAYYFSQISKRKFPDPRDFLVQEDKLPKDLTPIAQKKWEEDEKNKSTWTIMNICSCAVKNTHKRNPKVLSNSTHNIWMVLDYEIKDEK
jgi:hypothetical protein